MLRVTPQCMWLPTFQQLPCHPEESSTKYLLLNLACSSQNAENAKQMLHFVQHDNQQTAKTPLPGFLDSSSIFFLAIFLYYALTNAGHRVCQSVTL